MNGRAVRMPSMLVQKIINYKKIKTKSCINKKQITIIKFKKFLFREYIISIKIDELELKDNSEWEEI